MENEETVTESQIDDDDSPLMKISKQSFEKEKLNFKDGIEK